ncbi:MULTISPECIES: hypothetical protein [unclassified Ochrobactrum]|jgi:hypothetical protein|uniref:hypothetical protein n=1 Tax=unclassified Ochrobactrum TaxID=239106 RepID=UPI000DF01BFD|nr:MULTISPECIES: hypothetical protein [unclassified Ochrobactrum]MBQ0708789.1 hypothetical protein [Ochrobactrum sp. AP1BH01-1]
MIAPEELQRRIEKRLAESSFTQPELLIRRAHRLALEGENGSASDANALLKEAGSQIGLQELSEIIDRRPWLLETIINGAGKKGDNSGHH